jgi:hypothetical protein
MRKFECGDVVVLQEDHLLMEMRAGDAGVVVAWYEMNPPAYEVRFRDPGGKEFDALMKEDELDFPPGSGDASALPRPA